MLMGDFNTLPNAELCRSYKLKQIITKPTRKTSFLDKVHHLYKEQEVLAGPGLSAYDVVICHPQPECTQRPQASCTIQKRTSNHSARATLAEALRTTKWTPLYHLPPCRDNIQYFQETMNTIVGKHFQVVSVKVHTNDKPWVTSSYKALIQRWHKAQLTADTDSYKWLRNQINCKTRSLRSEYCRKNRQHLKTVEPSKWWKTTKLRAPGNH